MTTNSLTFADLGLPQTILDAVTEMGFTSPSPIQQACIPHLLEGRDVLGMAQTGSGKTAAFSLPTLAKIDAEQRYPQMLVWRRLVSWRFKLQTRASNLLKI